MTSPASLSSVPIHALELAAQGFRVMPLAGKVPVLPNWTVLASNKPDEVCELFRARPGANVGIATGQGLVVIDVDPDRGGAESLRGLPEFPPTVTSRTGGGGWHYYFHSPGQVANSRDLLGPGIDVRGDGGQVVAPPSIHPSGTVYTWEHSPEESQIAPAPAWLLDRLQSASPRAPAPRGPAPSDPSLAYRRAERYLDQMPPAISGQGGHDATFRAALVLTRGFCLPESEAYELLLRIYNPKCDPGWTERDLRHKIASAASDGQVEWGYLLNAGREPVPPTARTSTSGAGQYQPSAGSASSSSGPGGESSGQIPPGLIPITKSYASIVQILSVPALREKVLGAGELEFDEQSLMPCFRRNPLHVEDLNRIRELCELTFRNDKGKGIEFSPSNVEAAAFQVSKRKPFHPVVEYLQSLEWDQIPRIQAVAEDILGVNLEEQPLAPRLIRLWMISAVARALQPGAKVDTILVLAGPQGAFKSEFFRSLAGVDFFSDTPIRIGDKDGYLSLRSSWIHEWAELETISRARDSRAVKAFITSSQDSFRPPYDRSNRLFKRTNVFVGTTNDDDFLDDPTGHRRFWPIRVSKRIDHETAAAWRDQLWAEAVHAFRNGEHWWIEDQEEAQKLLQIHQQYERTDVWEETVVEWAGSRVMPFSVAEILEKVIGKDRAQCTEQDKKRVIGILRRNGFQQTKTRGYERSPDGKVTRARLWELPARS